MDTSTILTTLLTNIRTDVVNSMQSKGRYATGETVAALEVVIDGNKGKLLAPWWIDAQEKGRKPTSQGVPAGEPPMIERIKAWCDAKGIDQKAAWAIKKSIDKYGYRGIPGVLTEPLEAADRHISEAAEQLANIQAQKVLDLFNIFDTV